MRIEILFLVLGISGLFGEPLTLYMAPGPIDDLARDRGWTSSSREPEQTDEVDDVDSRTPEILAASIRAAKAADDLERQPAGLYYSSRNQWLRVDNAGTTARYVGTKRFTPLSGDFTIEFEVTTALAGRSAANFGLSDTANKLVDADHALFVEYRAFDIRHPYLRLMLKKPTSLKEIGRIQDVGRMNDKLIRIQRRGERISVTVQQDYVKESSMGADAAVASYSWLGSAFREPVPVEKGERTILHIDNIKGLDSDKVDERNDANVVRTTINKVGSLNLLRGTPRHLVVDGKYGYLAHGEGGPESHLIVLEFTADGPRMVSSLGLKWWPSHLDVENGIAYVPDGVHLQLVDVSQPSAPKVVSTFKDGLGLGRGEAKLVAVHERIVYLAVENLGLLVIDANDPSSPRLAGAVRFGLRKPTDILLHKKLLWLTSAEGISMFDVTSPQKPKRVKSGRTGRSEGISNDGLGLGLGLGLEDKPATPTKSANLKAFEVSQHPLSLARNDEYLFVVDRMKGLLVFENTDPLNPEAIGAYTPATPGKTVTGVDVHPTGIAVTGQTAFLTVNHAVVPQSNPDTGEIVQRDAGGGLHILNIADPLEPFLMGRYRLTDQPGEFVAVAKSGTTAHVVDARYGVWSVNCEDERSPELIGGVPTQGEIRDMAIEHGRAYLASAQGQGILAVDISKPEAPTLMGRYHTGFDSPSLAVEEGIVYTGSPDWALPHGLLVLNFRDPAAPELIRRLPARAATQWSNCKDLLVSAGGEVFDLKDPFHPDPFGRLPSGVLLRHDGLFYIARPNVIQGLLVIDPKDTNQPIRSQLKLSLDSIGRADIEYRDNTLFIAAGTYGVAIADISNPSAPRLLRILKSSIGAAVDIALHGKSLIVNDIYNGLKIFDATDVSRPRLTRSISFDRETVGYRSIVKDGYLYYARTNGVDVFKLD